MGLTWKDMIATLFTIGIVVACIAFPQNAGWPLLGGHETIHPHAVSPK
jgi:hypothetical protein